MLKESRSTRAGQGEEERGEGGGGVEVPALGVAALTEINSVPAAGLI